MFGLSIEKIVVLVVVALFVLGPERLPAAAAWLGKTSWLSLWPRPGRPRSY